MRPVRLEDRQELHRLVYADPKVAPFWSGQIWTLDEITESFAPKMAKREHGLDFQAMTLKPSDQLIGFQLYKQGEIEQCMIFEQEASRVACDPAFMQVELTYALGYAFWHQGYATEADSAMIDHGFRVLNIGRIVNSVATENVASVKLMKRLGFRSEPNRKPKPFGGPWLNPPGVLAFWITRSGRGGHASNISKSTESVRRHH